MTPNLTQAGKNLLLRALTGDTINFTKIQLGNGLPQEPTAATGLANPLVTLAISKMDIGENYVTLTASFSNGGIASGFHITEAGFFAQDPDDADNEILYAIGNEDESKADYVPDSGNRILEMQFEALIFVGDAENVAAAINSSLVYASAAEFEAHRDATNNPHEVTKAQVGLGNVPNVSTNDQTPTYTTATTFATLTSGERLSTAFGKIKLAITNLINHINNRSNPHGVTAAQAGAAAVAHTHNASTDINSGTMPVLRGGTGVASVTSGSLLRGNGTGAFTGVRGTGALYSSTTGNPRFGTLPLSMGGTGVTSLASLKNLVKDAAFVYGTYTGDNTTTRLIELGFKPSLVLVMCSNYPYDQRYSAVATQEYNGVISGYTSYWTTYNYHYVTLQIVDTGFNVTYCSSSSHAKTNYSNYVYHYIALK